MKKWEGPHTCTTLMPPQKTARMKPASIGHVTTPRRPSTQRKHSLKVSTLAASCSIAASEDQAGSPAASSIARTTARRGQGGAADRPCMATASYHRYIEYGRLRSESRPRIWQSVVTEVETTDPEAPAQKEVRCCSLVTLSTSSYMCGGASSPADTKPHAAAPHPKRAGQYMQSSCAKPHPLRGL